MNVEDLVRTGLRENAENTPLIPDLHPTAVARGHRRRAVRRAATVSGAAASVAVLATAGVLVAAGTGGGGRHVVTPSDSQRVVADPWWQTWTTGRHDGAIDQRFLTAARPTYDGETQPEQIKVWATGTMPDGTDWALFGDQSNPHVMQWLQGWNGQPDYGESSQAVTPDLSWTSWTTPTLVAHNDYTKNQQWLIVVGRPGTTSIEYSADGTSWQPMNVGDGIGFLKIDDGFPPATAKVQLSDATGVYATGTPAGAGAGQPDASSSPTATATPSTTPTS